LCARELNAKEIGQLLLLLLLLLTRAEQSRRQSANFHISTFFIFAFHQGGKRELEK
jgi:hypothetical protein